MYRYYRSVLIIGLGILLLTACSRTPDHVRYIPKDAVAVAGVNLKALSKKIAWNMITGSKLFKDMQSRIPKQSTKDAVSGIEKAGLDIMNTFYVYVKTDTRYANGSRITALIPLSDAVEWEDYVKRSFPGISITQHGDRKEANLGAQMYIGWTKNLLIIINAAAAGDDAPDNGYSGQANVAHDAAALSAEMNDAFSVAGDNTIADNKHFMDLNTQGHDVTLWLNYEQLMGQYMSSGMGEKTGLSLSASLWKDAGFAAGFDFVKGKITGDMKYYLSPDMKDIGAAFGEANADKDMVDRLPGDNMDMVMTMHISPVGIKAMLEKMGTLGTLNLALQETGIDVDNILGAFTGDMAFVMNDFSMHTKVTVDSFMGQRIERRGQKPSLNMSFVIKINKKEAFQKLVDQAKENGLPTAGNGFVIPIDDHDSVYIMMNEQYLVASNKYTYATGFLQGDFKDHKKPEPAVSVISGHPAAFFMDIREMVKNIDAGIARSAHDSVMITESKKLLNNISLTGGSFRDNAFEYHLDINFTNTDENTIIQLMDYGMKMSDTTRVAGSY